MKRDAWFKYTSIGILWLWFGFFALIPNLLVFITSFLKKGEQNLVQFVFSFKNYIALDDPIYFKIFWHSFYLAAAVSFICLVIAFPFSYLLSRLETRYKSLLLFLVIIPFWTSSLIRTYAIVIILKTQGLLNQFLMSMGFIHQPLQLLYTPTAVLIGLIYNLLPFMILPLYANIEKLDLRYIDAALDLGAQKTTIFFRIILPLALPGVAAGIILVFLPAMSMFYIPDILGGAKSLMIGNLIQNQFLTTQNWPLGAAVSVLLTGLMGLMLLLYRHVSRDNSIDEGLL